MAARGALVFAAKNSCRRVVPTAVTAGSVGDVILKADVHTDNLISLYYEPIVRGGRGGHGLGKDKHGKKGEPRIVKVPVGTLVYEMPDRFKPFTPDPMDEEAVAPEKEKLDIKDMEPIMDLSEPDQEYVLCAGGQGGRGNTRFKSSRNRIPRQFTPGGAGEQGWYVLELQTIAFAGLVGYPNAGKSTLISQLSAAHPRVASYPFTTLNPVVGVVELDGYRRVTVADIPGLIDGASENKGLGHEFLRHIVRCQVLMFVIDIAGSEGREPISDLENLRRELNLYDPTLADRPWVVIANKMDVDGADEKLVAFRERFPKVEILPVVARDGVGMDDVRALLDRLAGDEAAPE